MGLDVVNEEPAIGTSQVRHRSLLGSGWRSTCCRLVRRGVPGVRTTTRKVAKTPIPTRNSSPTRTGFRARLVVPACGAPALPLPSRGQTPDEEVGREAQ